MTEINVLIKVNPGREGVPMKKLASIYEDVHRFFIQSLSDLGAAPKNISLHNFHNSSVVCRACLSGDLEEGTAKAFSGEFLRLIRLDPLREQWDGQLSTKSLSVYSEIGRHLDSDEYLEFALADSANDVDYESADWIKVSKSQTARVAELLTRSITYFGAIYGKVHALYKESSNPHFSVREAINGTLVSCYYNEDQYPEVLDLLNDKDAFVHVSGLIYADNVNAEIKSLQCFEMSRADQLGLEVDARSEDRPGLHD